MYGLSVILWSRPINNLLLGNSGDDCCLNWHGDVEMAGCGELHWVASIVIHVSCIRKLSELITALQWYYEPNVMEADIIAIKSPKHTDNKHMLTTECWFFYISKVPKNQMRFVAIAWFLHENELITLFFTSSFRFGRQSFQLDTWRSRKKLLLTCVN